MTLPERCAYCVFGLSGCPYFAGRGSRSFLCVTFVTLALYPAARSPCVVVFTNWQAVQSCTALLFLLVGAFPQFPRKGYAGFPAISLFLIIGRGNGFAVWLALQYGGLGFSLTSPARVYIQIHCLPVCICPYKYDACKDNAAADFAAASPRFVCGFRQKPCYKLAVFSPYFFPTIAPLLHSRSRSILYGFCTAFVRVCR